MWPFPKKKKKPKKKKNTLDAFDQAKAIAAATLKGKFGSWLPRYESLLGELAQGKLSLIRRRCRESHVNSPVIASLVAEIESMVIGNGIQVMFKHDTAMHQRKANELWKEWTERKTFSTEGEMDFYQMQSLLMDEISVVGEAFVKKNIEAEGDLDKSIPINYQMMPPDQLYDQVDFGASTVEIPEEFKDLKFVKGIGYDKKGRKKAYIFYEDDFESDQVYSFSFLSRYGKKVISSSEVHHIYNRKEVRYRRGWPLIGTAIIYAHLMKLLDEAQLSKQLIASIFAAFVKDNSAEFSLESDKGEEEAQEDFDYNAELQSGTIYKLPTGKDVEFPNAPEARDYKDFDMAILRKIAGSAGVSFEALASNHSDANYSAARQSNLNSNRRLHKVRENVVIKQFLESVVADFKAYLKAMAILPVEGLTHEIYRPGKIIIDPAKEVAPKVKEIRAGLKSWSEAIRETGRNPESVLKQIAEDQKRLDQLGLKLDSDSRDTGEGPDENQNQDS